MLRSAAYIGMKQRSKAAPAIALTILAFVGCLTGLPILATASGGPSTSCIAVGELAEDGTPSILGQSTLTAADLRAWWASTGKGQPPRLGLDIDDLIAVYLSEGDAEGVRGDMAFAQAIAETGYFANSDTSIHNFAGIAHYDHVSSGSAFASPVIGVRAHIQLLKKYAAGNEATLVNPNVAPRAGASSATWGGLAGTWASSPTYWTLLSNVYGSMIASAQQSMDDLAVFTGEGGMCPGGNLAIAGDYALPVERRWYDEHPEWFTRPHHTYPAVDIPVPIGTPLYAITNGVVISTPTGGRCGIGVIFNGDDGAQYTYCHGDPGTQAVTIGDRVAVGQYLMDSASTGRSTGPHLHLGIRIDGRARCPAQLLVGIAEGEPPSPKSLPSSGCIR